MIHCGIQCARDGELLHHGFVNSDWERDVGTWKSTYGDCFSLGIGMISWFNGKQAVVTLSSMEAEYM
jgi:hypothetical protein